MPRDHDDTPLDDQLDAIDNVKSESRGKTVRITNDLLAEYEELVFSHGLKMLRKGGVDVVSVRGKHSFRPIMPGDMKHFTDFLARKNYDMRMNTGTSGTPRAVSDELRNEAIKNQNGATQ